MHKFERSLITEWRRIALPIIDKTIVVAVSGGADSIALLLGVSELKERAKLDIRIVAAHFNHGLRGDESDDDEAFVRQLVSEIKLELAIGHSKAKPPANIEENARNQRYDFLQHTAENLKAAAVLTAHTVDDQAETFLLNLIRGSGVNGLSGMPAVRDLGSGTKLARPLLTWARRADTEGYCHDRGVAYRFDTMNEDEIFMRVRIRKVLLPLLRDFNPKITERLAETARLLKAELPDSSETDLETLKISDLKLLSEGELKRSLRGWLSTNRGNLRQIGLKHIEAIEHLIKSRKSGKTTELPGGDIVLKERGKLVYNKNMVEKRGSDN